MRYRPIEERFAEKYTVNPGTKCWEWNAMKVSGGYGSMGCLVCREAAGMS